MTKKHTHEEYATINQIIIVITIASILVLVLAYGMFKDLQPTITQLAEAEGWEAECIETHNYTPSVYELGGTAKESCNPGYVGIWIRDICNKWGIIHIRGIAKDVCMKSVEHIECIKCTTYALRRHD